MQFECCLVVLPVVYCYMCIVIITCALKANNNNNNNNKNQTVLKVCNFSIWLTKALAESTNFRFAIKDQKITVRNQSIFATFVLKKMLF